MTRCQLRLELEDQQRLVLELKRSNAELVGKLSSMQTQQSESEVVTVQTSQSHDAPIVADTGDIEESGDIEEPKEDLDRSQTQGQQQQQQPSSSSSWIQPHVLPTEVPRWLVDYDGKLQSRLSWISASSNGESDALHVLAECLPFVIPNVLLAKREELLPLILLVVRFHPKMETRKSLTHSLFNLWKIPTPELREVIIAGCVHLAKSVGYKRTEEEILPEVWEQLYHKYPERRILVAESVSALAMYVSADLRSSLLLSTLSTLLDDALVDVRTVAAKSLTSLIGTMRDDDRYLDVQEIILRNFLSSYPEVSSAAKEAVLGPLSFWAQRLGVVCSKLITSLFQLLEKEIEAATTLSRPYRDIVQMLLMLVPPMFRSVVQGAPFANQVNPEFLKPSLPPKKRIEMAVSNNLHKRNAREDNNNVDNSNVDTNNDLDANVDAESKDKSQTEDNHEAIVDLQDSFASPSPTSTPPPRSAKLEEAVNANEKEGRTEIEGIQKLFDEYFQTEDDSWEELDWLTCSYLPKIARLTYISDEVHLHPLISAIVALFGLGFATSVVGPIMISVLEDSSEPERRRRVLPIYIASVYGTLGEPHVVPVLRECILDVAKQRNGWGSANLPDIVASVKYLLRYHGHENAVTTVLWELLIYPETPVRLVVVKIFDALISMGDLVSPRMLRDKVVPGLVTLSADLDAAVRLASIRAFGSILGSVSDAEVLEKAAARLDDIVESSDPDIAFIIVRCFAQAIPSCEPSFRDRYVLRRLISLSESPATPDIAHSLLAAFTAFHGARTSEYTIREGIIPGLLLLQEYHKDDESQSQQIAQMIVEMEAALPQTEDSKANRKVFRKKFKSYQKTSKAKAPKK